MLAFLNAILVSTLFLTRMTLAAPLKARSESHTINLVNNCGKGTPKLVQDGQVLSTGGSFTSSGSFVAGIAYLDDGSCLLNGEYCTTVEMTLVNPTSPGAGSSTDVTLISPHAWNVGASFSYFSGCDGQGQACMTADCANAFRIDTDYFAQTQCEEDNVGLTVTFC
ncbi:hypothetical protein GYMLUDRAFT_43519 [Collybiopsis luxurians FD-317 M1]|uniref:Glycopeptide n=1 Tax=Collybiopsis luxurians FD-317 M1 TaxID=944289 RepID=A0A0D0BB64_9AGAR|nr:hypothetical protein GYMLUDRAFT_43519 [Collybiopsis luxurians FD-317 M1]